MSLARCKGRDKCNVWTCYHFHVPPYGLHEANDGCTRYRDCETECEPVTVVPVSVLRDAAVMICEDCHGNDECGAGQPCEDMAALCAAIAEAEEESHGTDA